MRESEEAGASPTPIYDALCHEFERRFRALPGDRTGEEGLRFVGFWAHDPYGRPIYGGIPGWGPPPGYGPPGWGYARPEALYPPYGAPARPELLPAVRPPQTYR